jgi:hypothetical protein
MVITYNQNLHFKITLSENSRNKITIHFIIILILQKIHTKDEHNIHYRSLCFVLLKTSIKII